MFLVCTPMKRRPVAETITMGATAVAITSTVEVSIGTRRVACPFRLHRRQADSLAWRVFDVCRQWPLAAASRGGITNSTALRARGWWSGLDERDLDLVRPRRKPKDDDRLAAGVAPAPRRAIKRHVEVPDGGRHLERLRAEHRDDQQIFGAVADNTTPRLNGSAKGASTTILGTGDDAVRGRTAAPVAG